MLRFDHQISELIATPGIVGVDEAGRGPLAGPVVAAAVILNDGFDVRGINDSKQLSVGQRREQFERIIANAHFAIAIVDNETIDRVNILQASLQAMLEATQKLGIVPDGAMVDGNKVPDGMPCKTDAIVKGDGIYANIAAASILAKHTRDELMTEYSVQYPRYGFHLHFGYPTAHHISMLNIYGPCPIHRRTFSTVRDVINQPCLQLGD